MLDWSQIDNDKTFQRLVNDLFNLELGRPGLIPSSPYIGADGGWDGRFNIPYQGVDGVSSVQSKWTKLSFNDAYTSLLPEVRKELEKAKTNKVTNLYLATNAELRIGTDDHIGKLEALNVGHVSNFYLWHRGKLEQLIDRHVWLRYKYFKVPQRPLFSPRQIYLANSEPDLFTEVGLLERTRESEGLKAFIQDGAKKVCVIHAPQGHGKSLFLIEMAKIIEDEPGNEWQNWFCNPSLRMVEDAFQDEIREPYRYILYLDNADIADDTFIKLLNGLRNLSAMIVKLVISCRTPSAESITNLIDEKRLRYLEIGLDPLSESSLIELLKRSSQVEHIDKPELIVRRLEGSPFLVVAYGRQMRGQGDPADIKATIERDVTSDIQILTKFEFGKHEAEVFLREIAAIVPFHLTDSEVMDRLSQVTGKPVATVIQSIEILIRNKILRYVGSTVRFSSDLKGDVYLSRVLDQSGGAALLSEMFDRWLPVRASNMATNVADANQHSKTRNIRHAVESLIEKLIDEPDSSRRHKILQWIEPLASVSPDKVTDLISSYLSKEG